MTLKVDILSTQGIIRVKQAFFAQLLQKYSVK
jgi:hypothetical protein